MKLLFTITLLLLFHTNGFTQEVPKDSFDVTPLLINSTIPNTSVKTVDGMDITLHEVIKVKPTVFVFYRGGWCPYCTRHMSELAQIEEQILEMGYQIVGTSVDRPEILKATLEEIELKYILLSDSPAEAIKAFGLAFEVDQATVDRYMSIGIDLEGDAGHDHHILPAPAVYIVDQEGKVNFQYVNPNYRQRISGEILLAAAKTFIKS